MARKGQNLRVFVGDKCVAVATSCSFHVAVDTEEASSKDSVGGWKEYDAVGKGWDVSCDTMYDPEETADANAITPAELMDKIITEDNPEVTLKWDATTPGFNKNRTALKKGYTGKAIFNDASVNSPNRQNNTASFQFTGNGPLDKIPTQAAS